VSVHVLACAVWEIEGDGQALCLREGLAAKAALRTVQILCEVTEPTEHEGLTLSRPQIGVYAPIVVRPPSGRQALADGRCINGLATRDGLVGTAAAPVHI
jgi:hypothetical protein